MADPVTLMLVGTAVSAVGSISQSQNAAAASRYNAQISERNALIQQQNATLARQQAVSQSEIQRRQAAKQMGAMRAGYANSGVAMEGSPLDVLAASAASAELDTLNTIYNGELKARGFENDAQGLRESAAMDRKRAKNQITQGYMSAGASLLMGYGSAGMYGGASQAPAPVGGADFAYTGSGLRGQ